jgi:hypothetical protein
MKNGNKCITGIMYKVKGGNKDGRVTGWKAG